MSARMQMRFDNICMIYAQVFNKRNKKEILSVDRDDS